MRFAQMAALVPLLVGVSVSPAHALTIIPLYDSTITGDANGNVIMSSIQSAINVYQNTFTNNVTVNITFAEMSSGLGQSSTNGYLVNYSNYVQSLKADKSGRSDYSFVSSLPDNNFTLNGVTRTQLFVSNADVRTLNIFNTSGANQPDSTISLNTSLMNLSRDPVDYKAGKYDLMAVASHEIDEALGLASGLNQNNDGSGYNPNDPNKYISTLDLFRYDQNGTRSYTTSSAAQAYFSVDGGASQVVRFNQTAGGDYSDWYSPGGQMPQVQDAYGTLGSQPNLGTAEITALRAIGYNLAPTPEPSPPVTLVLGTLSVLGLMAVQRQRRGTTAV